MKILAEQKVKRPGRKIRLLAVCMWPLGGIRTYLKYNYRHFPKDEFEITVIANPVIEREAVEQDMAQLGIRVVWAPPLFDRNVLFWHTLRLRLRQRFDVVHSHGFISAFHVGLGNRLFHLPHAMTIHGVLEEKYLAGRFGSQKRRLLEWVLGDVDVFVGVGRDILEQVRSELASLQTKARWQVITNGIDPEPFAAEYPESAKRVRESIGVDPETPVFGFFGRFMPQKGFTYIIEAMHRITESTGGRKPVVLAVGSGDYEKQYKEKIHSLGLTDRFFFQPFQPNVAELIQGCDAILMPSNWEAYGLLAAEVMCCGVPIVTSDCIGLREAVEGTPAIVTPTGDIAALTAAMERVACDRNLRDVFREFKGEAARRYSVDKSAEKLLTLFRGMGR